MQQRGIEFFCTNFLDSTNVTSRLLTVIYVKITNIDAGETNMTDDELKALVASLAVAQKAAIQSIMKIQLHEAQPFYSGHTPPSPYVRVSVHCLSSRGFFV